MPIACVLGVFELRFELWLNFRFESRLGRELVQGSGDCLLMTRLVGLHWLGSAIEKLLLVVKTCVDVHLRLLDLGQVVVARVNFIPD